MSYWKLLAKVSCCNCPHQRLLSYRLCQDPEGPPLHFSSLGHLMPPSESILATWLSSVEFTLALSFKLL